MVPTMDVAVLLTWLAAQDDSGPRWALITAILLGALIAALPATWRPTRLLATYIHEAGHAIVGLLTGRRVSSMRLHADTSGVTETVGRPGLSLILTALAGYPAPALAGWGIITLLLSGRAHAAIATLVGIVLLLAVVQHSLRGIAVSAVILLMCFVFASWTGPWSAAGLAVLAGYLLAATPRTIVELRRYRATAAALGQPRHSDADILATYTGIPAILWELVFLTGVGYLLFQVGTALLA